MAEADYFDGKVEFFGYEVPMSVVECADHTWNENSYSLRSISANGKCEFDKCTYQMELYAVYEDGKKELVILANSTGEAKPKQQPHRF